MSSPYTNSPESNIDRVIKSLKGESSPTALSQAVELNVYFNDQYRHQEYRGRYSNKYDRETGEKNVDRLVRDYRAALPEDRFSTQFGRAVGDTRMYNILTELDADISNKLTDSRRTLAKIHNHMIEGTNDDVGAQAVYEYIYKDRESGAPGTLVTRQRNLVQPMGASYRVTRPWDELEEQGGSDLVRHMAEERLAWLVNTDILGQEAIVDRSLTEIERIVNPNNKPNKSFKKARNLMSRTSPSTSLPDPIKAAKRAEADAIYQGMDEKIFMGPTGIVNRPGILPFMYLFEQARSEIVIDTFQFQNEAISAYLWDVIERKVQENPDFKVTFRLGYPREVGGNIRTDPTTYNILGPNLLQIQKFGELNQRLKERIAASRGIAPDQVQNVIEFQTQDRKHHPKMYYTDQMAAIGTANLTQPVGSSVHQAGSNYEAMWFFRNRYQDLSVAELKQITSGTRLRGASETLMFNQIRELKEQKDDEWQKSGANRVSGSAFIARRGQLGLSGDIAAHLYGTVNFAHSRRGETITAKTSKGDIFTEGKYSLFMILDQSMLLQYDESIYRTGKNLIGEFGEFGQDELAKMQGKMKDPLDSTRHKRFRETQRQLFELIAENRAFITVDAKNFRESIYDPMRMAILGNETYAKAFIANDYDFRKLVGGGPVKEKVARLKAMGFNDDTQIMQLIAMGSGNIRLAAVPRQHMKSFALFERQANFNKHDHWTMHNVSGYLGSSNLGAYSLGVGDDVIDNYTSMEYGVLLGRRDVRDEIDAVLAKTVNRRGTVQSAYALEAEQENTLLRDHSTQFMAQWQDFGNNKITSKRFREVNTKPLWANSVDVHALEQFKTQLSKLAEVTGFKESAFKITQQISGTNASHSIFVTMDIAAMIGASPGSMGMHKFELTALRSGTGGSQDANIMFVQQQKVISRAQFTNKNTRAIKMPFFGGMMEGGKSIELSSQQNALSIIGTIAAESMYRAVHTEPLQYLRTMSEDTRRTTILNYLTQTGLGVANRGMDPLLDSAQVSNIMYMREVLYKRFNADAMLYENGMYRTAALLASSKGVPTANGALGNTQLVKERQQALNILNEHFEALANAGNKRDKTTIVQNRLLPHIDEMIKLFPELALDITQRTANPMYSQHVVNTMNELKDMHLEPYKTLGQRAKYGSAQGRFEVVILGLTGREDEETIRRMNLASEVLGGVEEGDVRNIATFARHMALPFQAGDDIGDMLIRGIADGGTVSDDPDVMDQHFLGQRGRGFGTAVKVDILSHLGVGTIHNKTQAREMVEEYKRRMGYAQDYEGDDIKALMSSLDADFTRKDKLLTFYTGPANWSKISQLPQRLKNALGARPMLQMSAEATAIMQHHHGNGLIEHALAYTKQHRQEVETMIRTRISSGQLRLSQGEIDMLLEDWFTEDFKRGALLGGKIRKVLSGNDAAKVEEIRNKIENVLGKDSTITDKVAKEVLRVHVLQASLSGESYGSLIGGADVAGKQAVAFIQLTGMYTDTATLNPLFGTQDTKFGKATGMMEAHEDLATLRVKGSMMGREGVIFTTKAGDTFMFDPATGEYVPHRNGTPVDDIKIERSGASTAARNVVESRSFGISEEPSIAQEQLTRYLRRGEMSFETFVDVVTRQPGMFETNTIQRMHRMLRGIQMSGGRRIEGTSSGTLAKAVMVTAQEKRYLTPEVTGLALLKPGEKQRVINEMGLDDSGSMNYFEFLTFQVNKNRSGLSWGSFSKDVYGDLKQEQIYGVFNPSNFKSFMWSHGSVLLRNPVRTQHLFGVGVTDHSHLAQLSKRAAAMLLMSYGTDFMHKSQAHQHMDVAKTMKSTLMKAALQGDLGGYYQAYALIANATVSDKAKAQDLLLKQASFNSVSTRALQGFNTEDLLAALEGRDNGNILRKLKKLIDLNQAAAGKEYMNMDDHWSLQSANIVSQLDFVHQLAGQTEGIVLPSDIPWGDEHANQTIKHVFGFNKADIDELERHDIRGEDAAVALMQGLASRVSGLLVNVDLSAGFAKDPGGANLQGRVEYQQLIKPMSSQLKRFSEGGDVKQLSKFYANMLAVVTGGSATQYHSEALTDNISAYGLLDDYIQSPFFKRNMLGIYASGIASNEFTALQAEYSRITDWSTKAGKPSQGALIKSMLEAAKAARELDTLQKSHAPNAPQIIAAQTRVTKANKALSTVNAKLAGIERKIINLHREYSMFGGKQAAVDTSRTVLSALNHNTMTLAMPHLDVMEAEEGGFIVRADKSKGHHVFLPSGKELQALGASKGTYVEDYLNAALTIVGALAPGTMASTALAKLHGSPNGAVLTQAEYESLMKLQNTTARMYDLMATSMGGARAEQAGGVHLSFAGAVTTNVPSFLVPNGMLVMGQAYLDEAGMSTSTLKTSGMNRSMEDVDRLITDLDSAKQDINRLRGLRNSPTVGLYGGVASIDKVIEDRNAQRAAMKATKAFLQSQMEALVTGTGQTGEAIYTQGEVYSKEFKSVYEEALKSQDKFKGLQKLQNLAKTRRKSFVNQHKGFLREGDKFARDAVLAEIDYWMSKAVTEMEPIQASALPRSKIRFYEHRVRMFENMTVVVAGFTGIGSRKQATDETGALIFDTDKHGNAISVMPAMQNRLALSANMLEGKYAGSLPQRVLNADELKGMNPRVQRNYLNERLTRIIDDLTQTRKGIVENFSNRAGNTLGIPGADPLDFTYSGLTTDQIKLLKPAMDKVNTLIDELTNIKNTALTGQNSTHTIQDILSKVQTAIAMHDYTNLISTTTWRPPPPGGTDAWIQSYTLTTIAAMNQYGSDAAARNGMPGMQYSEQRNAAAAFMNPIGMNTLMAGDFDGDSYVTIFNYIHQSKNDVEKMHGQISRATSDRKKIEDERDAYVKQHNASSTDPKVIAFNENLRKKDEYIAKTRRESLMLDYKIEVAGDDMRRSALHRGRKELANYLGLDERIFMASDDYSGIQNPSAVRGGRGGYLDPGKQLEIESLHTFIEQGVGLFPGAEGKAPQLTTLAKSLVSLVEAGQTLSIQEFKQRIGSFSSPQGATQIISYAQQLKSSEFITDPTTGKTTRQRTAGSALYDSLTDVDDPQSAAAMAEAIRTQLLSFHKNSEYKRRRQIAINAGENPEDIYWSEFNRFVGGDLMSKMGEQERAKLAGMASGFSMEDSMYSVLQGGLGKAGGQILGKAYNTLIATLYADAPILSLGHTVLKSTKMNTAVRDHINSLKTAVNNNGTGGAPLKYTPAGQHQEIDIDGDHFIDTLQDAVSFSEGVQGYMKSIHQMLRDSIKLKSVDNHEANKAQLESLQRRYDEAIERGQQGEADKILQEMAFNIGPGSGNASLRALVRLDKYVSLSALGADKQLDYTALGTHFGVAQDSDRFNLIKNRLVAAGELESNSSEQDVARAIARYQTADDLNNLAVQYRYEKSAKAGRSLLNYMGQSRVRRLNERVQYDEGGKTSSQISDEHQAQSYLRRVYLGEGETTSAHLSEYARHREAFASALGLTGAYEQGKPDTLSSEYINRVNSMVKEPAGDGYHRLDQFNESYFWTTRANNQVFGNRGQQLDRFSNFETIRRSQAALFARGSLAKIDPNDPNYEKAYADEVNRIETVIRGTTDYGGFDVIETSQRLLTQGKFSTKQLNYMAASLQTELGNIASSSGSGGVTMDDIMRMMYDPKRMTTNRSATAVYTMMSKFYDITKESLSQSGGRVPAGVDDIRIQVGNNADPDRMLTFATDIPGLVTEANRETVIGQATALNKQIVDSTRENTMKFRDFQEMARDALTQDQAAGFTPAKEDVDDLAKMLQLSHGLKYGGGSGTAKAIRRAPLAGRLNDKMVNALKTHEGGNIIDFFVPVALTVIGQTIATGDIDPETTQQIVGSTITAMAYSRSNFTRASSRVNFGGFKANIPGMQNPFEFHGFSRTQMATAALGGAFKLNSAMTANDGDFAKAAAEVATREAAFAVSALVSPMITETVSRKLMGNAQEGIMMGVNRTALDSDRFMASKTMGGSIAGAILSAAIGTFLGNAGAAVVRGQQIPAMGMVEAALQALEGRNIDIQRQKDAAVLEQENMDVTNSETGEVLPDTDIEVASGFYNDNSNDIDQYLQADDYDFSSEPVDLFG